MGDRSVKKSGDPFSSPITIRVLAIIVTILSIAGCDGDLWISNTHDKWIFHKETGPYIITNWTGVIERRQVYVFDIPTSVAVLAHFHGPDQSDWKRQNGYRVEPVKPDKVQYLLGTLGGLIRTSEVSEQTSVRVEGFMRPPYEVCSAISPPETGSFQFTATTRPYKRVPGQAVIEPGTQPRFPIIICRRIYEQLPGGRERLIWETSMPFNQL